MLNIKRFVFILATLAVSACSTVPSDNNRSARTGYDAEYMEAYETASIRGGAKVHWVNPPLRRDRQ